jgi:hypothetical protein
LREYVSEIELFAMDNTDLTVGSAIPYYFSPGLRNDPSAADRRAALLRQTYAWRDALPTSLQYKKLNNSSHISIYTILLCVLYK